MTQILTEVAGSDVAFLHSPLTREEPTTGSGQYAHICVNRKEEVTLGYIQGTELEALCGHRWVPSKSPKSLPICPPCKAVYDDDEARWMASPYPSDRTRSGDIN